MGLYLQAWLKRQTYCGRWFQWISSLITLHVWSPARALPSEQRATNLDAAVRYDLVRRALAQGYPLSELEATLDWQDSNGKEPS
jgi:hypothetical protein